MRTQNNTQDTHNHTKTHHHTIHKFNTLILIAFSNRLLCSSSFVHSFHEQNTQVNNATARVQTKKAPATLPQGKHLYVRTRRHCVSTFLARFCVCAGFFCFVGLLFYVFMKIRNDSLNSHVEEPTQQK